MCRGRASFKVTNEGKSVAEGPERVSLVLDEDKYRVSL